MTMWLLGITLLAVIPFSMQAGGLLHRQKRVATFGDYADFGYGKGRVSHHIIDEHHSHDPHSQLDLHSQNYDQHYSYFDEHKDYHNPHQQQSGYGHQQQQQQSGYGHQQPQMGYGQQQQSYGQPQYYKPHYVVIQKIVPLSTTTTPTGK